MAYPKPKRTPATLRANVSQSGFGVLRSFSHLPLESRMANLVQSFHILMLCYVQSITPSHSCQTGGTICLQTGENHAEKHLICYFLITLFPRGITYIIVLVLEI